MTNTQTKSGQRPPTAPWVAFTRTQWTRDPLAGVEHGTIDGLRTLCGVPVAGHDREHGFFAGQSGCCARCTAALRAALRAAFPHLAPNPED